MARTPQGYLLYRQEQCRTLYFRFTGDQMRLRPRSQKEIGILRGKLVLFDLSEAVSHKMPKMQGLHSKPFEEYLGELFAPGSLWNLNNGRSVLDPPSQTQREVVQARKAVDRRMLGEMVARFGNADPPVEPPRDEEGEHHVLSAASET